MGIGHYFNLRKSYVQYGAYHRDGINKFIHITCVPIIFSSALGLATYLKLGVALPAAIAGGRELTLADVAAVFYATSFLVMDPVAGLLYAPVIGLLHYLGLTVFAPNPLLVLGTQVVTWALQFIGHGVFERRKPALVDNLAQSLHAGVFFVWLEVLFMLGYRPALHKELAAAIEVKAAALKAADAAKHQ